MDYDTDAAMSALERMKSNTELIGYTEINPWLETDGNTIRTEISILFSRLAKLDNKYRSSIIANSEHVFDAIKHLLDKQPM